MKSIIPFVFLVLAACGGQQRTRISTYYNIDSLVSAQQQWLMTLEPLLNKTAHIDSDSSLSNFRPDSTQWANELDVFKKVDINKPTLDGLYTITVSDDTNSNLAVRTLSTDSREAEVKYLKLYYLDQLEKLKKIEALYIERNPIYASRREVTLVFDEVQNKRLLKRYKISGSQKMILQDTVKFEVDGQLHFD